MVMAHPTQSTIDLLYPPDIQDIGLGLSSRGSSPLDYGLSNDEPYRVRLTSPPPNHHERQDAGTQSSSTTTRRRKKSSSSSHALLVPVDHQIIAENDLQTLLNLLQTSTTKSETLSSQLVSTQASLALYKAHLAYAQKELDKASEVVKNVDAQRRDAEEAAVRARERERGVRSKWEIWSAREEGRREGWMQGLERGRRMAAPDGTASGQDYEPSEVIYDPLFDSFPDARSGRQRQRSDSVSTRRHVRSLDRVSTRTPIQSTYVPNEPHSRLRSGSNPEQKRPKTSGTSSSSSHSKKGVRPISTNPTADSGSVPLPIPPRGSPPRTRAPRQPPPPPEVEPQPSQTDHGPVRRDGSRRSPPSNPAPALAEGFQAPRPYHDRPPSPSASHKSIVVPPDNYIPTTHKEGEFIVLPPPHELSRPASTVVEDARPREEERQRRRTMAAFSERSRAVSRASTRISEYDIVSPPRGMDLRHTTRNSHISPFTLGMQTPTPHRGRTLTPTQEMVEQWRSQTSPSVIDPEVSTIRSGARSRASAASPSSSRRYKVMNPDDDSYRHDARSMRSAESSQPRRPPLAGPRRPREIVLPVPLAPTYPAPPGDLARSSTPFIPPLPSATPVDPNPAPQHVALTEPRPTISRAKTPLAWFRNKFQRTISSPGDVNIRVEPPSASPSSGTNTVVDPVLLTPEQTARTIAPTPSLEEVITDAVKFKTLPANTDSIPPIAPVTIVLPDNELPMGFVPQSAMFPTNIVAMNMVSQTPSYANAGPSRDNGNQGPVSAQKTRPSADAFLSPAPLNRPISLFSNSDD